MKNILIAIAFLAIASQSFAQKIIEKTLPIEANTQVYINAKFGTNITLNTWDKKQVYIKVTASINDGEYDDYFNLDIDNSNTSLDIEEVYGDLFDIIKKKYSKKEGKRYGYNTDMDISYEISAPKNTVLRLKSISGSAKIGNYEGDLTVDFISGDIDVEKYKGDLSVKSISGDIDIKLSNSQLEAQTFSGTIYADESFSFDADKRRSFGQKIRGKIGAGSQNLRLDSHSGNIYLRKV